MNKTDLDFMLAQMRNNLPHLTSKDRNEIAQMCIDLNQTTSVDVYSECLGIPKRTVYDRMNLNKITTLKINNSKYPSLKIIE